MKHALLLLVCGVTPALAAPPPRNLVVPAEIEVHTLVQKWTDAEANWFYNVAQGSKLVPYRWFLSLEQPDSAKLFRDNDHIRGLGYLPRSPGEGNPNGLPVGFVKDGNHLGLPCAACHTGQINYQGQAWLI